MTLNGTEAISHAANELGDGTPAPERAQPINNQQNPQPNLNEHSQTLPKMPIVVDFFGQGAALIIALSEVGISGAIHAFGTALPFDNRKLSKPINGASGGSVRTRKMFRNLCTATRSTSDFPPRFAFARPPR
jgi:hypothetical protein